VHSQSPRNKKPTMGRWSKSKLVGSIIRIPNYGCFRAFVGFPCQCFRLSPCRNKEPFTWLVVLSPFSYSMLSFSIGIQVLTSSYMLLYWTLKVLKSTNSWRHFLLYASRIWAWEFRLVTDIRGALILSPS